MITSAIASRRGPLGVTLAALALGSLGACGPAGSASTSSTAVATAESPTPSAAATDSGSTSPAASPTASASPTTASAAPAFRLTSPAFADGGAIPKRYACDGQDVSPPLAWEGAPAAARTLVLIVDDSDARGFIHWVAFNIDATPSGQLLEGASTNHDAPPQGTNGFGRTGWGGPCPPSGTHHYRFRLVAVREALRPPDSPSAADVLRATQGRIIAETTLTGLYKRS